ncbi:hypothetical protein [Streptomyces sp. JJ36]|uniref:hypothetical protein n=1 Tax=Streptomyces sp. JJ36 TaxID=2736645 RepID=UPI001F2B4082|nr:hypothetical protein [Streptomyces sp. JJ36]MCF6525014.1 hypothetical protein [Streptomyces sp. JJ36]
MPDQVNAPARAPFLQTPEALIDAAGLTDAALRLLQALVKLPPRNARNSDAVARTLRMGKDKLNAARKCLRAEGHWHARKRQNVRGEIRDQRLASLVPLRTPEEVAAGWAAAEEAARLGKDTAASRRWGVRLVNAADWVREPAAGSAAPRTDRRRPPEGDQTEENHTPLPVPAPAPARQPRTGPELPPLEGPLAVYAERAEAVLLRLRRTAPQLALPAADARELAQIAGHYLLRGEGPETIRAVVAQGLPPEGVRAPAGFVRGRLLRYLPPPPAWPRGAVGTAEEPQAPPGAPRPGGPVAVLREGAGWRAALRAARAEGGPEGC